MIWLVNLDSCCSVVVVNKGLTVEVYFYPNVCIKNLMGIRTSLNKNNSSLNSG
jgi:hypothetical protein